MHKSFCGKNIKVVKKMPSVVKNINIYPDISKLFDKRK